MRPLLLFITCMAFSSGIWPVSAGQVSAVILADAAKKPDWFQQSPANLVQDIATATRNSKRVVLYFYQESCPYCAKLLKHNFGNAEIAAKTRQHFEVIPINLWGSNTVTDNEGNTLSEAAFAAGQDVQATPTLLFLDEGGAEVLRVNGYYPPPKFNLALDYVAGRHDREGSFKDYYQKLPAGTPTEETVPASDGTQEPC